MPESVEVEVLVVVREADAVNLAVESLAAASGEFYEEAPDPIDLAASVTVRYQRSLGAGRELVGLRIGVTAEQSALPQMLRIMAEELAAADGIEHVVKFIDPDMLRRHQIYIEQIYELESRLREVLTVIFLDSGQGDYYDLLGNTAVGFMEAPTLEQMRQEAENEFFHLTFNQYRGIDERKPLTKVPDLIGLVAAASDWPIYNAVSR